jgi:hypothetical protein
MNTPSPVNAPAEKMAALLAKLSTAQLVEIARELRATRDLAGSDVKAHAVVWHFAIGEIETRLDADAFAAFCDSL